MKETDNKETQILRKENKNLRNEVKELKAANDKLRLICKFFADENVEIKQKYEELLNKLKDQK